jgi:heterodisulfide reductase subunit B
MLMTTQEEVALKLNLELLQAAVDNGAQMIATACPLCQMNLEGYQKKINKTFGRDFKIPVVYFSHLIGIALGVRPEAMGLDKLLVEPTKLNAYAKGVHA